MSTNDSLTGANCSFCRRGRRARGRSVGDVERGAAPSTAPPATASDESSPARALVQVGASGRGCLGTTQAAERLRLCRGTPGRAQRGPDAPSAAAACSAARPLTPTGRRPMVDRCSNVSGTGSTPARVPSRTSSGPRRWRFARAWHRRTSWRARSAVEGRRLPRRLLRRVHARGPEPAPVRARWQRDGWQRPGAGGRRARRAAPGQRFRLAFDGAAGDGVPLDKPLPPGCEPINNQ